MGRRGLSAALTAFLMATTAHADMVFEPAYAEFAHLGPAAAKGALVYNHGKSSNADPSGHIPAWIGRLRADGWDVFRLRRPVTEDNVYESTKELEARVRDLRAMGYGRVVSAGQSYGGWISLNAAARNPGLLHGVVATAPAAYGSSASNHVAWQRNGEIVGIAEDIRATRVMAFFFDGDNFDPGGRAKPIDKALATAGTPHLVIDRPAGHSGHLAADSKDFSRDYAACIAAFLDAQPIANEFSCDQAQVTTAQARDVVGLPTDIGPDLSGSITPQWQGIWHGAYDTGREMVFLVTGLRDGQVRAVYGWGAHKGNAKGWEHVAGGSVDPADGSLRFASDRRVMRFTANPDGTLSVLWTRTDGSNRLTGRMRRVAQAP
jgi:pimeloyl-ACP methyl ester carboxylesterase